MNKEEMIKHMAENNIDVMDVSTLEETNGWRLVFGHYEPYLFNHNLSGVVGSSIYQSDIDKAKS